MSTQFVYGDERLSVSQYDAQLQTDTEILGGWFWPMTMLLLAILAVVLSSLALADSNEVANDTSAVVELVVLGDVKANRIGRGIATTNRITKQTIPYTTSIEAGNVNMDEDSCTTQQYLNFATNRVIVTGSGWKFIRTTNLKMQGNFSSSVVISSVKPITLVTEKLFLKGIEYDPNSGAGDPGQKGEIGVKGAKGEVGADGSDGAKGAEGDLGLAGEDSLVQGATGTDGQDGPDGATGDTGAKGADGEKGEPGFLFNDPTVYPTIVHLLAATGMVDGDFGLIVTSPAAGPNDGELYGYDGTNWELIATLAAPGAKGAKGEPGLITDGDVGETGAVGAKGNSGPRGDQGETGAKGAKGQVGDDGVKGAKGDKGVTGPDGPDGESGNEWVWTAATATSALRSTLSNVALSSASLGVRVLQFDVNNATYRGFVKVGWRFGCPQADTPETCPCPSTYQYEAFFELKSENQTIYIASDIADVDDPSKVYFELEDGIGGTLSECVSVVIPSTLTTAGNQQLEGTSQALIDLIVYVDGCPVGQTRTDSSGNWSFVTPSVLTQGQVIAVIQSGLEDTSQIGAFSSSAVPA